MDMKVDIYILLIRSSGNRTSSKMMAGCNYICVSTDIYLEKLHGGSGPYVISFQASGQKQRYDFEG